MVVDGHIPEGRLCRSRTDADVGETLAGVLDRELTGYVVFEPQGSILRGGDERAVLTFEEGVPVLAYHAPSDTGGTDALGALSGGLFHAESYELPADALADAHRVDAPRPRRPTGWPTTTPWSSGPARPRPTTGSKTARTPARSRRSSRIPTGSKPSGRKPARRPKSAPRSGG